MIRSRLLALLGATLLVAGCAGPATPSSPSPESAVASSIATPSPVSATPDLVAATPAPSPTCEPTPGPTGSTGLPLLGNGPLCPGDYQLVPGENGWDACYDENTDCVETPGSKTISLTLTLRSEWEGVFEGISIFPGPPRSFRPPDGMDILVMAGGYLHEDPCLQVMHAMPMIPVDPTSVDSFVDALVAHPLLDVSEPRAITLGGFNGKYLELTAPEDLSDCVAYRPWEPGLYAQGPLNRWRLWVVDVDGTRMTIMGWDFPGTPESDRAELEAIVNSIRFVP